jgi:hypothetical protein
MTVIHARTPSPRCGSNVDEGIAAQEIGQAPVGVGTDHEVERRAPEQTIAEVLRHAAGEADLHVRAAPLVARQITETAEDPLLGVLADRTGVEQNHVRRVGILCGGIAGARQVATDQLRVRQVHLAAVGFDIDARHRDILLEGAGGSRTLSTC